MAWCVRCSQQRGPRMAAGAVAVAAWVLAAVLCAAPPVGAMEFDMVYQTKCVMEEINSNVLVFGEYAAFQKNDPSAGVEVDVKVEDPHGVVLYEDMAKSDGTFAFTSKSDGDYKICFTAKDIPTAQNVKIRLEVKTGVAAKDWDSIAKKSNLNAMATELMKLEEVVREIHREMLSMRQREEDMRNLNETTNSRVAMFSIVSLLICIAVGLWQLVYLKSFFVRKKLL